MRRGGPDLLSETVCQWSWLTLTLIATLTLTLTLAITPTLTLNLIITLTLTLILTLIIILSLTPTLTLTLVLNATGFLKSTSRKTNKIIEQKALSAEALAILFKLLIETLDTVRVCVQTLSLSL